MSDFAAFGNTEIPLVAYFPTANPQSGAAAQAVSGLEERLAGVPGVVRVTRPQFGAHLAQLTALSNLDASSDGARNIVKAIRAIGPLTGGGQILVYGQTANDLDVIGFIIAHMAYALAFVLAVTFAVLLLMTGSVLPPEEEAICEEHDFPVLRKPFLATDVMNQIRGRLANILAAGH